MSTNCFVAQIDLKLADKLRTDLKEKGFTLSQPPYTLFSAKKKGISCTLYTSGKLTVQGKDKDDFITYYLEPEILQTFTYAYPEQNIDMTPRIGVDEAGKGDFFGPLCIAAVYADASMIEELLKIGIKESKKAADKTSLSLAKKIKKICPHSLIIVSPKRYNEIYAKIKNLNQLLAWGHAAAITETVEKTQCTNILVDQFTKSPLVQNALNHKGVCVNLTERTKADEDPVVAAASILARAAFLTSLEKLSIQAGITLHKGASSQVIAAGKQLVNKHGKEILPQYSKIHFKTTEAVLR